MPCAATLRLAILYCMSDMRGEGNVPRDWELIGKWRELWSSQMPESRTLLVRHCESIIVCFHQCEFFKGHVAPLASGNI